MIRCAAVLAALALATAGLAACQSSSGRDLPDPRDFLIQSVCVDASDRPIFADPVSCPDSRRKLRIGEPLPYHKMDVGGFQVSDSYPIASADELTLGVQTYFFADAFDQDPAFPRQVRHNPARGGYNILGADERFTFFRGTSDPGAYWQPWWTPDCRAEGWLLFPSTERTYRSGRAASPATFAPGCEGTIRTNASTVEWAFLPAHPYVADPADPGRTRVLESIRVRHFSAGHGSMEANYFTREYGVTRWEAWSVGEGLTPDFLKARCPGVDYDVRHHGKMFSMVDCRTWTTLVRPEGGSWDPDGASALDPTIQAFPVDPLYTGGNWLTGTHQGGRRRQGGDEGLCRDMGWRVETLPSPLVLGTVDDAPWNGNGNCVRTILAESLPVAAYGQTIAAPLPGAYRFGVSLFAPDLLPGRTTSAEVRVVQHDAAGRQLAVDRIEASAITTYRSFEARFDVHPAAATATFEVTPLETGQRLAVTGALIARVI